jgi:hypothetical protein
MNRAAEHRTRWISIAEGQVAAMVDGFEWGSSESDYLDECMVVLQSLVTEYFAAVNS